VAPSCLRGANRRSVLDQDGPIPFSSLRQTLLSRSLSLANLSALLRSRARLHPNRPLMLFEGREWTYGEVLRCAQRFARTFEARRAARGDCEDAPFAVGLYAENTPQYVFAVLGAALSGATVFGLNTGFRGEILADLVRSAELDVLYVRDLADAALSSIAGPAIERLSDAFEAAPSSGDLPRRRIDVRAPFLVIYTSGSTGLPKGVVCSQLKLVGAGLITRNRLRLRSSDRGYVSMPLFHSNAWFLGIMATLVAGGSFVLRRKFSARGFEEDLLRYGITWMNYVGQPMHYIVAALEARHSGEDGVERALADDPRNRFRLAHGNGATPIDRQKLVRYLGMEHIWELYGSTEATITTVVEPGDPLDSVGRIRQRSVLILDSDGRRCPPGELDETGKLANYDAAVGEICRKVSQENLFFDGYFKNASATSSKYRDGHYHSGDLGYIRHVGRRRYLYFEGRTNDWIRKDGENFSAATVARFAAEHPGVAHAVAYGAPAPVADELVMVALQLRPGAAFDPDLCWERFEQQQTVGGMDPKWMPDFIRVVRRFEQTETNKILVGPLKRRHVALDDAGDRLWYRQRGDTSFRRFGDDELGALRQEFAANGRARLLDV
jgi:fatty-acyl-CoA synthase